MEFPKQSADESIAGTRDHFLVDSSSLYDNMKLKLLGSKLKKFNQKKKFNQAHLQVSWWPFEGIYFYFFSSFTFGKLQHSSIFLPLIHFISY